MQGKLALVAAIALASSAQASAEFRVKVGEKKVLPLGRVKGAAVDNSDLADLTVLADGQLSVLGKESGRAKIDIIDAHGKLISASLSVTGGPKRKPVASAEPKADPVPKVYFGGKRVEGAYCTEPLSNGVANRSFEQAWDLLRKERTAEAVAKLEEALQIEPTAAVLHLYLGAARAKLQDQSRGAYHYETFALSCPNDPKAPSVLQLLQEFYRTMPKPAA
jgi:hypothetical protein